MDATQRQGFARSRHYISLCVLLGLCSVTRAHNRLVVDLNVGETKSVQLSDGTSKTITLLSVDYQKDVRGFVRGATAAVRIGETTKALGVGMYNLPVKIGDVRIDCTVTRGYYKDGEKRDRNWWNLAFSEKDIADYGYNYQKDARLRIWPADSTYFDGTFRYPINQRWGASYTQLENEHVAQNVGNLLSYGAPYYHAQVDIGASTNKYEIRSPVSGVVIRRPRRKGKSRDMLSHPDSKYKGILSMESGIFWDRCDYDLTILDERGWVFLFGHMRDIRVELGDIVQAGDVVAYTGDVGTRWPHLHFGIWAPQPSGKYGTESAYAYLWESYVREHSPSLLAVTGHHHLIKPGETVTLSAEGSTSFEGKITDYTWMLSDGSELRGETAEKTYNQKGMYTEILRVKDGQGNTAYNTSTVYVANPSDSGFGRMWVTHFPSLNVKAGDSVQFEAKMIFAKPANASKEAWDFGDGSASIETDAGREYARPSHSYDQPGDYVVSVKRNDADGNQCIARVVVQVEPQYSLDRSANWQSLFDGKTLDGWEHKNGTAKYEVKDGTIVGTTVEGSWNSFLCTKQEYADFELQFDVRVHDKLNSGVQIRSKTRERSIGKGPNRAAGRVIGPQVEIESSRNNGAEAGYIYAEGTGVGWLTPKERLIPHKHFRDGQWNHYRIVAKGPRIRTWLNGTLIEDLTDEKAYAQYPRGFIGLQVHRIKPGAGPYSVAWRHVRIKTLPQSATTGSGPIALHPDNPHYFVWNDRPTILITSGEHYGALLNLDFDYERYFEELKSQGLNHTRIFAGTYRELPSSFGITDNPLAPKPHRYVSPWARSDQPGYSDGGNKFDLTTWDDAYFTRLRNLMRAAQKRGVVVELTLFCPMYKDELWSVCPMSVGNNTNGIGDCPREEAFTLKHQALVEVQIAVTRKIVHELRDFDNLYYEVCNEPYFGGVTMEWQNKIVDTILAAEKEFPAEHLISLNIANGRQKIEDPHPAVSIFNFHYCVPPDTVALNYGLNKVIGENETGFRGQEDVLYRTEAWDFLLAGGALYNNLDYSFTPSHPDGSFTGYSSPGGGSRALRRQLQVLSQFLNEFDFVRMAPDPAAIRSVVPELTSSALVEPGKAWAVYLRVPLPNKPKDVKKYLRQGVNATVTLDLPSGRYEGRWVDTKTGQVTEIETFRHRAGGRTLQTPAFDNDIALRINRVP